MRLPNEEGAGAAAVLEEAEVVALDLSRSPAIEAPQ